MKAKNPNLSELLTGVEKKWYAPIPYINAEPDMASIIVNCCLLEGDTMGSVQKHIESFLPAGMSKSG